MNSRLDSNLEENTTDLAEKLIDQVKDTSGDQSPALRESVEQAVNSYFTHLDGQQITNFYQIVLSEVEAPLLEAVMKHTRYNQSKASVVLGLNRGTLRKKLKQYGLL